MYDKLGLRSVVFVSVPFAVRTEIRFLLYCCCLKALIGPSTSLEWLILLHISQGWQRNWRLSLWYQKCSQYIPYTRREWTAPGIPCCSKLQRRYQVLAAVCHVQLLRHLLPQTTKKQVQHSISVYITYVMRDKAEIDIIMPDSWRH